MLTPTRTTNRIAVWQRSSVWRSAFTQTQCLSSGWCSRRAPQALAQAGRTVGPPPRRDFAKVPGVRLWFTDTGGNGEPVVLMPNAREHRDERGMGAPGGGVFDPATGAQPGHASEDLHTLADYLLKRVHLVGVAGGGFVALDYAAWHPDRLSSLVVGASTGSVSDREIQDFIARIESPGIRSLPAPYREVSASYRGASSEGTKRWLEIERHARQPNAPAQPLRSSNTFAKLGGITTRTLVIAARRRSPCSARPHATLGSPRQGRPVGDGAGCGPLDCLGAARSFQRHRPAILEGRAAVSERPAMALAVPSVPLLPSRARLASASHALRTHDQPR